MAVNIQYEDPIGKLIESLPGILLEKKRIDIAAQEAEDLRDYRGAEQERLRQEASDLAAYREDSIELEEHKEMMDMAEGLVPEQRLQVLQHMFAQNPDYMPNGQALIDGLTIQVNNIALDRTNFAKANSQLQNKNISGAATTLLDIKDPNLASNLSTAINTARKTQWEVSRPELSREQQVLKLELELINERLELELDAREYNVSGLLIDPYGEVAQTIAGLRAKSKTAFDKFEASLAGTPVTPPAGRVTPPGRVVTPGGVVTPPVITPTTRQYSFRVTSSKLLGVGGDYGIEIIDPAGNSIEVEAAKADRVIKKGKRVDRDNYLGRMKTLFGVDEAEAIKLLSKAYASRKGEVGELQGGTISVRVDSGLSSEDEEALDAVLQEYSEE
jgi:hypothetical protein